jgi:hypothetical protein
MLMSFRLAAVGETSRNEARRRLLAEVKRCYGSAQAKLMAPRLVSVREVLGL